MIFTAVKWYALIRGLWVKPRNPMRTPHYWLRYYYLAPIREQLNIPWEHERILMGIQEYI